MQQKFFVNAPILNKSFCWMHPFYRKVFAGYTHFEEKFSMDAPILNILSMGDQKTVTPNPPTTTRRRRTLPDLYSAPHIKSAEFQHSTYTKKYVAKSPDPPLEQKSNLNPTPHLKPKLVNPPPPHTHTDTHTHRAKHMGLTVLLLGIVGSCAQEPQSPLQS